MKTIYLISSGSYSDYSVHGFFETEEEANAFCLVKNRASHHDGYYVEECDSIDAHFTGVIPATYHITHAYFHCHSSEYHSVGLDVADNPHFYKIEISDEGRSFLQYEIINYPIGTTDISIDFFVREPDRDVSKKIYWDMLAQLKAYYAETGDIIEALKMMNAIESIQIDEGGE